jgi:hypothetical protein
VTVGNLGLVTLNILEVGNTTLGSNLTLHGGGVISGGIDLRGGSILTVDQEGGIGLTLNGTPLFNLTLDSSATDLVFMSIAVDNWGLAWKDPSSTQNSVSTLTTLIDDGEIKLTLLPGQTYQITNSGGYTYIDGIGGASVPEPSAIVLACLGAAGVGSGLA